MLVGDRESLFYLDLTGTAPGVRALEPGIHVLENRPLEETSGKAAVVSRRLQSVSSWHGCGLVDGLARVLSSHEVPGSRGPPRLIGVELPPAVDAACVHAGPYGTRSSTIVVLPSEPEQPPMVLFADGAPCEAELNDVTCLWHEDF